MPHDAGAPIPTAEELAAAVLAALTASGRTIAVAESCTGGLLGGLLTSLPGSSAAVLGGVIAYSNSLKRDLLGVPAELIDRHGAVSAEVARAMALGAAGRCGADVAVAVTGIAGPGGGSADKPVGTVWFGWAVGGKVRTELMRFPGDRATIRGEAVRWAVYRLADLLGEGG